MKFDSLNGWKCISLKMSRFCERFIFWNGYVPKIKGMDQVAQKWGGGGRWQGGRGRGGGGPSPILPLCEP